MIEPRRPFGPRDANDGWVSGSRGRFWGKGGAAGLLAHDPARGVLLQHRVAWSDQGGTWGIPGGARHVGESAIGGAIREATEEAGVPPQALRTRYTHCFDVGYWSYTTVVAEVSTPFEAHIADPESEELRWVRPGDVESLPLHPAFAAAWPLLRERLAERPALVIDAANVVGSRPDGWWKDRAGATERLIERLGALDGAGLPGRWFGLDELWRVWPETTVVVEGHAKQVSTADLTVHVARAAADGDREIVAQVAALSSDGWTPICVVTSDRELRERVRRHGAAVVGAAELLAVLDG
ncbi:NYN domain-containing protein [Cumulibacter manganitolerans]|uniref:NYN domain-containing protein n=1 Tax=Cumulibacter manganitolerans TaxID=1884992 RepID=UPI001295E12C|nr:NYN domain-containing protein [Cumulibacter manganitolerans]